jgi:hypothetical protein
MAVAEADITTTTVRYDSPYRVVAADGTEIPLPWKGRQQVKFPVVVSTVVPQEQSDFYSVTVLPLQYSGFVDKWTDKIVNSDFLLKLASQSLPRSAGFAAFAGPGAIVGAVLATLFTPSNISRETKITRDLDDGVKVVYWILTTFRENPLGITSPQRY